MGKALRMRAEVFHEGGSRCATLQNLLLRYTAALLVQLRQLIACNGLHKLEERLCRWLLMVSDRTGTGKLSFTQERIADKLGVRRPGITIATNNLEKKRLISCARGQIELFDRAGLEEEACECYQLIKDEYDHLLTI